MENTKKFRKEAYLSDELHPCSRLIVIFEKLLMSNGITTTDIMDIFGRRHTTAEKERNFVCDMASKYLLPGYSLICFRKVEVKNLPNPSTFRLVRVKDDTRTIIPKDIIEKAKKREELEKRGLQGKTEYAQKYRVLFEYLLILSNYKLNKADFCNIFHADEDSISRDITCINKALEYINDNEKKCPRLEYDLEHKHYRITG